MVKLAVLMIRIKAIASKLSKNQKVRDRLYFTLSILPRRVRKKVPKPKVAVSSCGIGYIFFSILFTFCNGNDTKIYGFLKKNWRFGPTFFRVRDPAKSTESTGGGSNPSMSYVFLHLISKRITKHNFFEHQNQVVPLNILSRADVADSGHPWRVFLQPHN